MFSSFVFVYTRPQEAQRTLIYMYSTSIHRKPVESKAALLYSVRVPSHVATIEAHRERERDARRYLCARTHRPQRASSLKRAAN